MHNSPLLKTFLDLIQIDSPSGHEVQVSKYIENQFKKLKIAFKKDHYGNLIARVPGKGQPVLLSSHMDTVDPGRGIKAKIKGDFITSVGDTILGADDKAGIAEILEAVRVLKQTKKSHRPLEIVFTREEEIGIVGALKLKKSDLKSKEGLVLDGGKMGAITIASPFIYLIDIEIKGRAAHAGAHPEKGINAIQVAAKAISQLKLGRIDAETTNNIGILQSGLARNGVPEYAHIKAEARSHVEKKAEKQIQLFKQAFEKSAKAHKAKLKFKASLACVGYKYPITDPLVKEVANQFKLLKIKPTFHKSGGGSDVNAFTKRGIHALDISYGGENPHTTQERVRISHMQKMVELIVDFVSL